LRNKQSYGVVTVLISVTRGRNVCIFARFKVSCEVMPQRSFPNFKLVMSRLKKLRGA